MTNSYHLSIDELEMRVQERTAELEKANRALRAEVLERNRVENELIRIKDKLEAEIRDTRILHKLSTLHIEGSDLSSIFQEIVEAAIAITRADKGNIQILDPSEGKLRIASQRGFDLPFSESLKSADEEAATLYKTAVERMESVVVEDITKSSIFIGSNLLNALLNEGIRAVLSTPIFSQSGGLLGIISIYFNHIHTPAESELIFVDILARQAADIIDRKLAEGELRENREDRDHSQAVENIGTWRLNVHKNKLTWSDENYRIFGIPIGTPLTYETFLSTVHTDDREYVIQKWKAGLTGEPYDIEHRIIAEGRIKWVREKAILEFDKNGKLLGGFGITQDVTKSKRAEEALRQTEQRTKLKLESILSPARELASLELAEIVDVQAIQSLMNDFFKLTNIPIGLNDLKGNVLISVGWQEICTRFHRIHPEACKHCIESDTKLSAGVVSGEHKLYKCKSNMWDIVTPIMIGSRQVGILFLGQFFFEDEPLDYDLFRSQAKQYCFNEKEYIAALEKVPRLNRKVVETGTTFLTKLANMISQLSHSNIKLSQSLEERDSVVEALRESEKREQACSDELATVLDSIPAAVWIAHDPKALQITGNRFSCEWLHTPMSTNFSKSAPEGEKPEMFRLIKDGVEIPPADMPLQMSAAGTELNDYEIDIITSNGKIRHLLGNARPLRDEQGNLRGSVAAFIDITERKRAERALRESEERYRIVADNTFDWEFWLDPDNRFLYTSPSCERVTGYAAREFMDNPDLLQEIIHPDDRQVFLQHQHDMRPSRHGDIEFRIVTKDSKIRWIHHLCQPLYDGEGHYAGSRGSNRDITERKQVEETLVLERSQLLSIFDGINDVVYVTDPYTYKVLYANKAMKEKFGGELVGGICYRQFQRRDSPCDFCTNPIILMEREKPYQWEYYNPTVDRYFIIMDRIIKWPDGRDVRFEIAKDITERKRAEEALRLSNLYNRSLIEASLDPLVTIGYDGKIKDVNGATEQVTGCLRNDLIGTDFSDYFTEPENARKGYQQVFTKGEVRDYPLEIQHKDGHITPVLYNASVYRDENGDVIGVFAAARDITERKKAEEALNKIHDNLERIVEERTEQLENAYRSLKESEKGLADAQRMAHIGNWRWNILTGELFWSDEVYRIFGLNPQEFRITCDLFLSFIHPDDRNYLINAIKEGLKGSPFAVECRIILANGEERIVFTEAEAFYYEENIPIQVTGIVQDITERKRAEKELEKLNRIRIKEIHHRIKNNLQVISSLLDLQAEKFQSKEHIKDSEVLEAFEESQNRVLSMSLIHEELYKGEGTDKLNFSAYVQRLAKNLFQAYSVNSKNVRLCMDLEENSFFDMDTAIPLGIIVNELVSNSLKHAFNEKQQGEIRIRLCREEQEEINEEINESLFSLIISDNGKGIPENLELESLESLGLQLVSILVDQLDGKIKIRREQGTEFRITFNVAE